MRLLQMVRYVMMKGLFRQGHVSRGGVCWERSRGVEEASILYVVFKPLRSFNGYWHLWFCG
jgi:hypothetical protein